MLGRPPGPVSEPTAPELSLLYRDEPDGPPSAVVRMVVAACTVGVLAASAVTGYVLTHRSPKHSAAPPSGGTFATVRQAEAWIRANVPAAAPVNADATVAADLIAAGYPATGPGVSVGAGAYLVTTAENRDRARRDLAGVAGRISSLPVASFGSGVQRVDVSLLVDGKAVTLGGRLAREASERRTADQSLLNNPRLALPTPLRPWLADARLDLRAATVIALLAARTDVHVVGIAVDPAEAAAHRPARTMALSVPDRAALTDVLRALPSSYAPMRVSARPGGVRQLTWPVGLAPEGLF